MLAGVSAEVHGLFSNRDQVPPELVTLAQTLSGRGYNTCGIVSNGLLAAPSGLNRGFELWDDTRVSYAGAARLFADKVGKQSLVGVVANCFGLEQQLMQILLPDMWQLKIDSAERGSAAYVVEQAGEVVTAFNKEQVPHFLFLHMMDTHAPYVMPDNVPEFPDQYQLDELGRIDTNCLMKIQTDLQSKDDEKRNQAKRAVTIAKRAYAKEVGRVDLALAELNRKIIASGRPYLVLLTSDHGEHFAEHGLMEHANSMFEPLLRVPFMMWGSQITPQKITPPHLSQINEILLNGGQVNPPPKHHLAFGGNELAYRKGDLKWVATLDGENLVHKNIVDLSKDNGEIRDLGEISSEEFNSELLGLLSGILKRRAAAA